MITVACATDDGEHFIKRHFGDSESFVIYELDSDGVRYLKTIENISIDENEEGEHGDENKAKQVMMLFKELNVKVLANKNFGPNINRIKEKFLPLIIKYDSITEGLEKIRSRISTIENEFDKGSERKPLIIE